MSLNVAEIPPSAIRNPSASTMIDASCSAPMCDVFLVLAYAPGGLTCFVLPRVLTDGRRNGLRIERLKDKLSKRLGRLILDQVDSQRLAQEVAYLADKADVNEEVKRLFNHCEQFRGALDEDEPVGRKLDFLLQEMNREVNTVGSKASDNPVSERVVRMKTLLERMREQSANVE